MKKSKKNFKVSTKDKASVSKDIKKKGGKTKEKKTSQYDDRDLSWIKFEERIRAEAEDESKPLWERINFASIVMSNLDEFMATRGQLLSEKARKSVKALISEMSVTIDLLSSGVVKGESFDAKNARPTAYFDFESYLYPLYNELDSEFVDRDGGYNVYPSEISLFRSSDYIGDQMMSKIPMIMGEYPRQKLYFASESTPPIDLSEIYGEPILTDSDSLPNFEHGKVYAVYSAYKSWEEAKLISVEIKGGGMLYSDNMNMIFPMALIYAEEYKNCKTPKHRGYSLGDWCLVRIVKDMSAPLNPRAKYIRDDVQRLLSKRRNGDVVMAHIFPDAEGVVPVSKIIKDRYPKAIVSFENIFLTKNTGGEILSLTDNDKDFNGVVVKYPTRDLTKAYQEDIGGIIDECGMLPYEIMLWHPYDPYDTVLRMMQWAATSPNVVGIRQTLYRVASDSRIVDALITAAQNGKFVTVVVEVRARYDEERNLRIADRLVANGVNVIYGVAGVKTHSKVTIISYINKYGKGLDHVAHLGTGNYNESTAKIYSDISLITSDVSIVSDAIAFFNSLNGQASNAYQMKELIVAPTKLKKFVLDNIKKQGAKGYNGFVLMKMNALLDNDVINALYNASKRGCRITLIVRGMCCLKAGVPHLSDNITVKSTTGRYLEHSRIYIFGTDADRKIYCSSADMMPRNLVRRNEIMFPINDMRLQKIILNALSREIDEIAYNWEQIDGEYTRIDSNEFYTIDVQNINGCGDSDVLTEFSTSSLICDKSWYGKKYKERKETLVDVDEKEEVTDD